MLTSQPFFPRVAWTLQLLFSGETGVNCYAVRNTSIPKELQRRVHGVRRVRIVPHVVPHSIWHFISTVIQCSLPLPVAAQSKVWACCRSVAGIAGSNSAGVMDVCLLCVVCCVLSGRGLCDGPITSPVDSYRVWNVWVWSWNLDSKGALPH